MVLICISLMDSNTEDFFICLWPSVCPPWSSAHFLIEFLVLSHVSSLYIFGRFEPCPVYHGKYILPHSQFPFHFVNGFFSCTEDFYFIIFSFLTLFIFFIFVQVHLSPFSCHYFPPPHQPSPPTLNPSLRWLCS